MAWMNARVGLLLVGVGLVAPGCQRLPDGQGPITSAAANGTGDDGAGTFGTFGTFAPADGSTDRGADGATSGCDPVRQSGCGAAERCTATATEANAAVFGCVPDDGSLDPYEACEQFGGGLDGCPAGHACIANFAAEGACLPLCGSNSDCDRAVCLTSTEEKIPYCADDCSPFEPLCTAPTQCRRNGERFSCRVPAENDVGQAGDACQPMNDGGCSTGLICVAGALQSDCMTGHCCAPVCDLSAVETCASPEICSPAIGAPAPGFEDIGACFVAS